MAPLSLPNLKRFSLNLLGFFLPRFCLFCGAAVGEAAAQAVCPECEVPDRMGAEPPVPLLLPGLYGPGGRGPPLWRLRHETPPYDRARAAALYEGPVAAAIKGFKFSAQMTFLPVLQSWLHRPACLEMAASADLLVPVPLHPRRLKARGFNQSWLLARGFKGAALGQKIITRVRYTVPQVGLKPKERRANVRAAFSVSRPEEVQGKNVLLIDDLYTTGSTVKECALALRRAGAARVEVLTVARVKQE